MTDNDMIPRSEALAMVAAAYEDAEAQWFEVRVEGGREMAAVLAMAGRIRARTDADALAALERVKEEEQAKFLAGDWDDRDDDMTAAIRADFRSDGFFDRYDRAMHLVGNRKSKGSLVALVCFLLRATDTQEE